VRPVTAVTNALKRQQLAQRPSWSQDVALYEEDHIMPLELGGAPAEPANLRPQLLAGDRGARAKDVAENAAKRAVCTGEVSLRAEQLLFWAEWGA
jgi:hypothetical protein